MQRVLFTIIFTGMRETDYLECVGWALLLSSLRSSFNWFKPQTLTSFISTLKRGILHFF